MRTQVSGDQILDGTIKPEDLNEETAGGLIFGNNYCYNADEELSETTSTEYIEKVSIIKTLPAAVYRINWCYSWFYSSVSYDFKARIIQNDSVVLMEHIEEPQENDEEQRLWNSGFKIITISESGEYTFKLEYCSSKANKTAGIMNARLDLWRVGNYENL